VILHFILYIYILLFLFVILFLNLFLIIDYNYCQTFILTHSCLPQNYCCYCPTNKYYCKNLNKINYKDCTFEFDSNFVDYNMIPFQICLCILLFLHQYIYLKIYEYINEKNKKNKKK